MTRESIASCSRAPCALASLLGLCHRLLTACVSQTKASTLPSPTVLLPKMSLCSAWVCGCMGRSYWITFGFILLSLVFLPLLPSQKEDTQARKQSRPRHSGFAVGSLALVGSAVAYSLTISLLSIFPSTRCLRIAGGDGCS